MRVLLVDDHEIVWNGTRRLLEHLAGEIEPGHPLNSMRRRCREACLRVRAAFDLVLLDYHLPTLSGLRPCAPMKAHFEATPVCMQSAEGSAQRVREVIEAGAAGFIPKSYRLDDMEAALRVVLRHRVYLPADSCWPTT